MKSIFLLLITIVTCLFFPDTGSAQAPTMGTAADFVLFSSGGAVSNTGISHLTGHVGTNSGSSTGFGNVDGVMHDNDVASALCTVDLLFAYNQLNSTVPTFFPAPLLGNGQVLTPGVFFISGAATMNADLTLDALGDPNAVFIFQIQGSFSTAAASKVHLANGALACNVFWKIEGLVSMASGTTMRGTIIANNAGINMSTGDTLEGRALTTTGAITIDGVLAYTPIGCGSPVLTGPVAPSLAAAECYAIFSADGPVTNVGVTYVTGDIGTNNGSALGYNPLLVTGAIHPVPDGSTAACATDLTTAYNYLDALPYDIELLYPAQFGNNLVLTPHTYLLNAATTFTDTLFLNAENFPNSVFFIHINGALTTSTYSKVVLINGAQAQNVYWEINGAVTINDYSIFCGTIICNNGAMNINTGTNVDGRVLTTTGALATSAATVTIPFSSASLGMISGPDTVCQGQTGVVYTIASIPNASSYNWILPPGFTITAGINTDSITVDFANNAVSDTITVQGNNACGNGTATSFLFVNIIQPVAAAGIISGPDTVCLGQTGVLYTIAAIPNTSGYNWNLPIGAIIVAGANTDSITVDFGPTSVTDTIGVMGSNSCGNGPVSAIFIVTVIQPAAAAGIIIGPDTVCQGQTGIIYSVPSIANASDYTWTVPVGVTITAGANTDSITVDFSMSASTGVITVQGSNFCDSGTISIDFLVTVLPAIGAAGIISGPDTVCQGQTGVLYTIAAIPNATGYNWTLPLGALIVSGMNTDSITVDFSLIATSGNITVQGTGSCGNGPSSANFFVTVLPAASAAGIISGPDSVCQGQSGVLYTIAVILNATNYNWTVPAGATIISGANSDSITVNFSSTATSGIITVQGSNACGNGLISSNFLVTVNPTPVAFASSNSPVCTDSTINLSADTIAGASYDWSGPNGYTSAAQHAQITSAGSVNAGTYSLTVTSNGCPSQTVTVSVAVDDCSDIDFHIPDAFSPNGDGTNDFFVIRGINYYPENTFQVFNRWGNKVFEASPYENTWDGKSSEGTQIGGDQLPVGTYFYLLDLGDGTAVYKGTIYLNR